jgi:hypothetical protein
VLSHTQPLLQQSHIAALIGCLGQTIWRIGIALLFTVISHCEHSLLSLQSGSRIVFFTFSEDARWNPDRNAVEFGVEIANIEASCACFRSYFQRLPRLNAAEAYHLYRTRLELIAERQDRRRQLTDDGNVEIAGLAICGSGKLHPQQTGSSSVELLDKGGTTSRSRRRTPVSCQSQDRGAMRLPVLDKSPIHALLY